MICAICIVSALLGLVALVLVIAEFVGMSMAFAGDACGIDDDETEGDVK